LILEVFSEVNIVLLRSSRGDGKVEGKDDGKLALVGILEKMSFFFRI
jgi:hypothetical protein